jgi:hypothetical protein
MPMASSVRTRKMPTPSPGKQSHPEVSAVSLESIHEDLTEIKNYFKKKNTVKEDKLESLVTSIMKKKEKKRKEITLRIFATSCNNVIHLLFTSTYLTINRSIGQTSI